MNYHKNTSAGPWGGEGRANGHKEKGIGKEMGELAGERGRRCRRGSEGIREGEMRGGKKG